MWFLYKNEKVVEIKINNLRRYVTWLSNELKVV